MNKIGLIALLLFFYSFYSKAQDSSFVIKKKFDTTFIQTYKQYLTLGIFTLSPANFLTINTYSPSNNKEHHFTTNIAASLGFTAAYRSIYVAFAFKTNLDAQSIETYGKSRFNGFGIKVNNRKFNIGFESGKIKGFYNSDITYNDNNNATKHLTRGDIELKAYSFNGVYNFNHKKFSILAPSNHTERQIKSKAGFLLKASVSKNLITSDSSVTNASTSYTPNTFNRLAFTSYKVGPGVGLNLIFIKRFYLSLIFYLSSNLVYYNYSGETTDKIKGHAFTTFLEGRTAIGYQSKRFYIGLNFNIDRIMFKNVHLKIENVSQIGSFTIGYRFPAPGILKKVYQSTLTRYLGL